MRKRTKPMQLTPQIIAAFWAKVARTKPDECWEWQGEIERGYGVYRDQPAHRWSYLIEHGSIPKYDPSKRTLVMHECNNPSCVNPRHLKLGTVKENAAHMKACGRDHGSRTFGENQACHILTERLVILCRKAYAERKATVIELSEKCRVSTETMYDAIQGVTWKHIPGAVPKGTFKPWPRLRNPKT